MDFNPSSKSSMFLILVTGILDMIVVLFCFALQASQDKKSLDVGANLFVGNLDPVRFCCAFTHTQINLIRSFT